MRSILPFFLAAAAAFAQPAQPGPRPPARPAQWVEPDRAEPAGTHYRTFASRLAKSDVSYQIYLPPDYDSAPNRRYPVIYWLHGYNGDQRSGLPFVRHLDTCIREGTIPPHIVVLPNGMRTWFYNDAPDGSMPVESVIVKELIPHVDATYRTVGTRDGRSIEGFSMGGYGAAHLGFKYPEVFHAVGIMSGALIPPETLAATREPVPIFAKMFGADMSRVVANDPFELARKNADALRGKTLIRVAVGGADSLLARNRAMHELLDELQIPHEFEVVPGIAHAAPRFYDALGERAFTRYK